MTALKLCSKCEEPKPATLEYFSRDRHSSDGLDEWCKLCASASKRAYHQSTYVPEPPLEDSTLAGYIDAFLTTKSNRAEKTQKLYALVLSQFTNFLGDKWPFTAEDIAAFLADRQKDGLEPGTVSTFYKALRTFTLWLIRRGRLDSNPFLFVENPARQPRPSQAKAPKPPKSAPPLNLQPELQQAISAFLNAKALKAKATWESYELPLRRYAAHVVENNLIQWPGEADIWADNINSLLASFREQGLKDTTLVGYYEAICVWLRWLKRRKRIQGDIIEMIEKPPRVKLLPKVVKEDDLTALLETLKAEATGWLGVRNRALIILALDTGQRLGEIAALTFDRLDVVHRTINIPDSKTGQARMVVFSDNAAGPLQAWLEVRERLAAVIPGDLSHIFVAVGGNRPGQWHALSDGGMAQMLKRIQKRAGIKRFNFHRLRHSYAVYTLRAHGDLLDVQRQLGHTNIGTTAIYLRVDDTGRQARHNQANPLAYLNGGTL